MAKMLTVTVDEWIWDAIEVKKNKEKKSRSRTANELLYKALLHYEPGIDLQSIQKKYSEE